MGIPISYGLVNPDGTPCTTASPVFVAFCTKAGGARSPQAIGHFSGGQYEAQISDADELAGTAWLIDNNPTGGAGGPLPRYVYGSSTTRNNPFLLYCSFTYSGALSSSPPTVGAYTDRDDNVRPFPTVVVVPGFAFLSTVTPTLQDLVLGTSIRMDGAANTLPVYLYELFYNPDATDPPAPPSISALSSSGVSIEDAIRAWVKAGTGFNDAHVLWWKQTGSRPLDGAAWASIRLGGTLPVGAWDELEDSTDIGRDPGTEIEMRALGRREQAVTVTLFAVPGAAGVTGDSTANEHATRCQLALALPSVREALAAAGLSPFDNGKIMDLTPLVGTVFEGRSTLDVRFYVTRTLSEFAGYIGTVNTRDFTGPPKEGTRDLIDI